MELLVFNYNNSSGIIPPQSLTKVHCSLFHWNKWSSFNVSLMESFHLEVVPRTTMPLSGMCWTSLNVVPVGAFHLKI
jgi:hypothetical protein